MLGGLLVLLAFALGGEAFVYVTGALVPGNVVGMVLLALTLRSVTTPIAIGVAESLGGVPPLTAVVGPAILRAVGVRSATAFGLAMGAAHGIGTARAFEEGEAEGTASGLAIGLCGVATAVLTPLLVGLLRVLGVLT